MEQAKSRLDVKPGPFSSGYLRDPAFNGRNDVIFEEAKGYPQKRRPALGHKRAHFSLKPDKICPSETLKPTVDIDYLKDPEEFFMAYERLENAKREIQKQMGGVLFELNKNNKSPHARQRRPGLLRSNQRRLVRYKHRYLVETSDNHYQLPSFQEIFESGSQGLVGESTEKTGPCLASLESELTDSSAVEEKIDDILNELQHSSCEDLQGDVAIPHLQESLQIRPIVLQKLSIPDLADNQLADSNSFGCNLSNPRKVLSNKGNLLKTMQNKTPLKHRWDAGSTLRHLPSALPTPPKSPCALLSSLLKHCSSSSSSVDPFPLFDNDNLPTRNTPEVNQEINLINSGNPLIKDVVVCMTSSVGGTRNCANISGKSREDNSKKLGVDPNFSSKESLLDIDLDMGCIDTGDGNVDAIVCRPNSEVHEEDMQEAVPSVSADDPELNLVNPLDQSNPVGLKSNATDECTVTSDDGEAEQHFQVLEKTKASRASFKQRKDKSYSRREHKNKIPSRRQNLAAAGNSWKSGVRRSTRIKTRPLEYWKGERLVYGRVHESLATVIGVKYMSPGSTDGKPTLKVKSYVSDEHRELLEMASKY
ncbi:centromere protein C-like [Prosopis cineraria]|uniref:centromere protein C-like n=1 Tax=Prosopis cineraria TaxID=364024 RepID=UPI00240F79F7|nr:centromere protein C-like [Prosopis cineraria]XP_054780877.1 centromere protein C-like [Prosopis cineraria]XP_054780879.1 centromere protein C-like [Prosopis cineraria]